jgi:hypothetical protein
MRRVHRKVIYNFLFNFSANEYFVNSNAKANELSLERTRTEVDFFLKKTTKSNYTYFDLTFSFDNDGHF